jgi:hypothetical protein
MPLDGLTIGRVYPVSTGNIQGLEYRAVRMLPNGPEVVVRFGTPEEAQRDAARRNHTNMLVDRCEVLTDQVDHLETLTRMQRERNSDALRHIDYLEGLLRVYEIKFEEFEG